MEGLTTTAPTGSHDSAPRKSIQKLSESFCAPQYAASLKCLDDSDYDKSKCQEHFEAYKACRKQEEVAHETRGLRIRGKYVLRQIAKASDFSERRNLSDS